MKFLNNLEDASKVQIIDIAENFTSTNVETALAEAMGDLNTHKADGTQHGKTARFVIGTSTAGWTAKDCHYLCDGTADQTEINAAITALPATGGEIVILDGTYNITAKINVTKDNVSIRGSSNATILKRMYDSTDYEGVITLNSRSGCKIANLQMDGNKSSYTNNNNCGIYLSNSSNNTITGNTCNNNNASGIYLYSSSNNTVTDNTYNNNGYGIYLENSIDNTVAGNTCNNNNNEGICLDSSSNSTVTGNTCNNNNNYGIYLYYISSNNTVIGNTCNNNRSGIHLYDLSNNTVAGNTCNNNNNEGIYLVSSSNSTVTGNTCNNNVSGIYLYNSSNNTVTGNTCLRGTGLTTDYTASQHTIQLGATDNNYNLISNNNCMGKAVTNGGGTGNTLVNNKFDATADQNASEVLITDAGDYFIATDVEGALAELAVLSSSGSHANLIVSESKSTYTLVSAGDTVPIGIAGFDSSKDFLFVYVNSVYDADYTISGTNIVKNSGTWDSGTIFNFVALVPAEMPESATSTTIKREEFTATASQTVFHLTGGTYAVGTSQLDVFVNGIRQPGSAYTETDSNTITFASGLTVGDKVLCQWFESVTFPFTVTTHAGTHKTGGSDVLTAADIGAADIAHNHDSDYADIVHNHDSDYADITHNHDSDYADIAHNHDSDYADILHNHDSDYATAAQGTLATNALPASGGTISGSLAITGQLVLTPTTLATTETVNLDFSGAAQRTQGALTGNIVYTASNYAAGRTITIKILNGATLRTLTFPAEWVFVGTKPANIAASKTGVLTVTSFGTTEADCVAAWAVQS